MTSMLAKTFAFLALMLGVSSAQDLKILRDRYVPMGYEDPADALVLALGRTEEDWAEDLEAGEARHETEIRKIKIAAQPKFQDRLEGILKKLVAQSHRPTLDAKIVLHESINAEVRTFRGRYFYVTFLLTFLSDDDLAFVLAHELAHVMARHSARTADLSDFAATLKPIERDLLTCLFQRILETEADLLAVLYVRKAGFRSPSERAFETLRRCGLESGELSTQPAILMEMDRAAKEIVKYRAECDRLNKLFRTSSTAENFLKMADAKSKLDAAHAAYRRWSDAYYQNAIAAVAKHPTTEERQKACRAMEALLDGKSADSPNAKYVFDATR